MNNLLSQPFRNLQQRISRLPLILHSIAAFAAFMLLGFSNTILDASYAASGFPVPYAQGQTTFDGQLLKSYYQFMIDQGSLGIYWQTQFIDFGFIASVFLAGLLIPTLFRRGAQPGTWAYAILTWSATLLPFGAIFDAIENLISFILLSQPQTFPDWMVYPYSAFAVAKFACIGLGMLTLIVGLLAVIIQVVGRWMHR